METQEFPFEAGPLFTWEEMERIEAIKQRYEERRIEIEIRRRLWIAARWVLIGAILGWVFGVATFAALFFRWTW